MTDPTDPLAHLGRTETRTPTAADRRSDAAALVVGIIATVLIIATAAAGVVALWRWVL